jgi:hypothetical protein
MCKPTVPRRQQLMRERIARQVAEYQATGGSIVQHPIYKRKDREPISKRQK